MALFCPDCGTRTDADAEECVACGSRLPALEALGTGAPTDIFAPFRAGGGGATGAPEDRPRLERHYPGERSSVPFELVAGELVMAAFVLTSARGLLGRAASVLYVTDARVVYRAEARNVLNRGRSTQEIQLADVAGIDAGTRRGLGPLGALVVPYAVLSAIGLAAQQQTAASLLLLGLTAVVVALVARRTTLYLTLVSRQTGAPVIAVNTLRRPGRLRTFLYTLLGPWIALLGRLGVVDAASAGTAPAASDGIAMLDRIGSLILDLQGRGVLGGGR